MATRLAPTVFAQPETESFEDELCLNTVLTKIFKNAPAKYQCILALLLGPEALSEQEIARELKVSRGRVNRARHYLQRALDKANGTP